MDLVLELADTYALDKVWATALPALLPRLRQGPHGASLARVGVIRIQLFALLGLKDAASWAASASTSALSPSSWFENTVLKNAVASALGGEAVNWSALQSVSALPRDNVVRQTVSLLVLTYIGILVLYFTFAGLSYKYIFNKEMEKHRASSRTRSSSRSRRRCARFCRSTF